jgi:hypothetical protein
MHKYVRVIKSMSGETSSTIRFRVDPADVPEEKAARRLYLTVAQFREKLPRLLARGFPAADPDTGMYDLEAIDVWRRSRHPGLFCLSRLTAPGPQSETALVSGPIAGLGDKFRVAKDRKNHDPRSLRY